jgi:hypothetical protein
MNLSLSPRPVPGYHPGMGISTWEKVRLSSDEVARFRFAELELYVGSTGREWRVATRPAEARDRISVEPEMIKKAPDLEWRRIAAPGASSCFRLEPVLPDRPLVVYADTRLTVLPDAAHSFMLELPLFARLIDEAGVALAEIPLFATSKTWFGDTQSGTPCYAIRSRLTRAMERGRVEPPGSAERAACPVTIRNGGKVPVDVVALAIYGELLALRDMGSYLVADPVDVIADAEGSLSMRAREHADPAYAQAPLAAHARVSQGEKLIRRGAGFLKTITGGR